MLTQLIINNFILISHMEINLDSGFTAITGETGAGKSILLEALNFALGAKTDTSVLKPGTTQTSVSALFTLPKNHIVYNILKEQDLPNHDHLILRRHMNEDGRSRVFLNDQTISLNLLRQISKILIEIVGQFEHQDLNKPDTQRYLLDTYSSLEKEIEDTRKSYSFWQEKEETIRQLTRELDHLNQEQDYLQHIVKELSDFSPKINEEKEL
ncbi:MAG: AAA family ATPase, partial [Alphaproteobacteria bacterium]|nr:AAA family ATPase [Alphaproteobacteria bacterium]